MTNGRFSFKDAMFVTMRRRPVLVLIQPRLQNSRMVLLKLASRPTFRTWFS